MVTVKLTVSSAIIASKWLEDDYVAIVIKANMYLLLLLSALIKK